MLKKFNWILVTIALGALGCSSVNTELGEKASVSLNTNLFSPVTSVISEQELYSLTEQQQQEFLRFYQLLSLKGYLPHKAVERFLQSNLGNFTYYGKTYIASKAMSDNSGNCMSLAILTTAFSRLVGVEMDYRKMHSLLMYEKHGNVILSSSHVQSLLYDPSFIPEENYIYLSRPAIVIDYFPQEGNIRSKTVDSIRFLAMYYVNKAAEFYIESDFNSAFAYAQKAYQLDGASASAMNLLALLHKKKGDDATAESLYLAAISSSDVNISVLDNYVNLLKKQSRFDKRKRLSNA